MLDIHTSNTTHTHTPNHTMKGDEKEKIKREQSKMSDKQVQRKNVPEAKQIK